MKIQIDKIIRSKRRTVALIITKDGSLIVRAPFKTPLNYIEDFVNQKQLWILKKQSAVREYLQNNKSKEFRDGENFWYLGEAYQLKIDENKKITLTEYLHFPFSFITNPKEHLIVWYKQQALKIIAERAFVFSKITGLKYKSIKINSAKKRLGSCSFCGNINFTWRLIMTPLYVIDYVVVHELAHLEVKNHSKQFWDKVRSILPEYEQAKKYLKENRAVLQW